MRDICELLAFPLTDSSKHVARMTKQVVELWISLCKSAELNDVNLPH